MSSESGHQERVVTEYTNEEVRHYERLKLLFLAMAFFFIIASYTVARELKDSVFAFIVGREYINRAKLMTLFGLVPAILLYSRLVDKMRRYYLLCAYSAFYAIAGLIFAYFLGDPIVGIPNTDSSPYRIFGWLLYFFIEGYSPFVVSVFWAFANSVSSPETAKNYGLMVSGSKIGGMMSSALAWYFLVEKVYSDTINHQVLLFIAALMLLCVPVVVMYMMKCVPGRFLHGYEAVYRVEKRKQKRGEAETGIFAGLKMLIRYPYVLGIFGMVFFYEVVTTVLSIMRIEVAQATSASMSETTAKLFKMIFATHAVGFVISIVGTGTLIRWLGERTCLMLIPISSGIFLSSFMLSYTSFFPEGLVEYAVVIGYVGLKSVNYAFSWPVRESLYIPTVKEIKFKSKSWIDAFGSKFAKATGSMFTLVSNWFGASQFFSVYSGFFGIVVGLWLLVAYLLGRRFEWAVEHDEVIGIDNESSEPDVATVK